MSQELYTAYAELEAASEAFYAAASKMAALLPQKTQLLCNISEEVNFVIVEIDTELDEVL